MSKFLTSTFLQGLFPRATHDKPVLDPLRNLWNAPDLPALVETVLARTEEDIAQETVPSWPGTYRSSCAAWTVSHGCPYSR